MVRSTTWYAVPIAVQTGEKSNFPAAKNWTAVRRSDGQNSIFPARNGSTGECKSIFLLEKIGSPSVQKAKTRLLPAGKSWMGEGKSIFPARKKMARRRFRRAKLDFS